MSHGTIMFRFCRLENLETLKGSVSPRRGIYPDPAICTEVEYSVGHAKAPASFDAEAPFALTWAAHVLVRQLPRRDP